MFLFNIQITSQSHHLFFHTLILENTEDDGFLWNKRVSKMMLPKGARNGTERVKGRMCNSTTG